MKIILTIVFSLYSLVAFSQLTLKKTDGTVINDGDVLVYNSIAEPTNYLGLKIYNSLSEDVSVKIKVVSFPDGQGSNLQLCIDPICVNNLVMGNSYPSFGSTIPANGENGNSDHFLNSNAGDGINSLDYVLKLFRVDENNAEVGNSITFTYRYTPNLSNTDFNQLATLGIQLKSTLVKNNLELQVTKPVSANIYDVNGKLIVNQSLVTGDNSIEASKLASGLYILSLTTNEGKKATVKIIKE
ncbi:T9SS type A sorting domain-containing protein [Flavobacterium sp.]|jgi:hypothetical protein|uniref:T9SS type A sorting domain-containing protein n=1 Tax=Flavobacterium sp. TaxID=239 RepID=UPI0037BFF770